MPNTKNKNNITMYDVAGGYLYGRYEVITDIKRVDRWLADNKRRLISLEVFWGKWHGDNLSCPKSITTDRLWFITEEDNDE